MDRNGVRTHDVSQLVPSKHDAVISNDYNVEIIGDKKISLESEAFKVIIRNGSDYMLYYGVLSGLEVFYGERWYKVPFKDNVWDPIVEARHVAQSDRDFWVGLAEYELYPGKYRIVKEFYIEIPSGEDGEDSKEEILASFEFNLY